MKIQLILPKAELESPGQLDFRFLSRLFSPLTGDRQGTRLMGGVPLALPTIAALTPPDVEVSILDEQIQSVDFSDDIDIVGISLLSPSAERGYQIAGEFKKRGAYVVLGGIHASLFPLEAQEHGDTVFVGEVEDTWPKFLRDFKNKRPERTYAAEFKPDLRRLVIPRWDLLETRKYYTYYVQSTRGCVFDCDFCSVAAAYGKPRHKPIENVIAEIQAIRRHASIAGFESIYFSDDNIFSNSQYSKELFRRLIPLKIRWSSSCSVNIAKDGEALALAKESGCENLLIGFESISQTSLDSVNKGKVNSVSEFEEAIDRIHAHGINIVFMTMLGLDGDDEGVFKRTVDFLKSSAVALPVISVLTPVPGTRLHAKMKQEGRLLPGKQVDYCSSTVIFEPKNMSVDTLQQGFYWVLRELYSLESILQRIEALWAKGVIKREEQLNVPRLILSFVLLIQSFREKGEMPTLIRKTIRMLWQKRGIEFHVLLMNLSQFDYVRKLPVPRIPFDARATNLDHYGQEDGRYCSIGKPVLDTAGIRSPQNG